MPVRKTKYETDIRILEKELIDTKYKLEKLKSSRLNQTVDLVRGVKKNPKTIVRNTLKVPVAVLKRKKVYKDAPTKNLYNPLTNGLPLFKYTNVSIGLMLSDASKFTDMFMQTCNANDIEHENIHELSTYKALQAVVIDIPAYTSRANGFKLIREAIENDSKLIVLVSEGEIVPEDLKQYSPIIYVYGTDKNNDVNPFSNIYNIIQRQCPRLLDDVNDVQRIYNSDDLESIGHLKVSVLTKKFLSSINFDDACRVLDKVAMYDPIIVEGSRPPWIPESVMSFTDDKGYENIISNLNEPYAVDGYGVKCGRGVVVNHNSLTEASKILVSSKIIDESLDKLPNVSVIISAQRPDLLKDTLSQLERQTLRPYEIILMLHGVAESKIKTVEAFTEKMSIPVIIESISSDVLFGDVLNRAVDKVSGEYTTKVDDDDFYGENHLMDLYAAHISSRADFVGKTNNWTYLKNSDELLNYRPKDSCRYVRRLPGATMFARTAVFKENKFGKVKRMIDSELYRRAETRGAVIYSTHKYNFVRVRHGDHTYVSDDDFFKKHSDENITKGAPKTTWSV